LLSETLNFFQIKKSASRAPAVFARDLKLKAISNSNGGTEPIIGPT